jgi:hypothetical protein
MAHHLPRGYRRRPTRAQTFNYTEQVHVHSHARASGTRTRGTRGGTRWGVGRATPAPPTARRRTSAICLQFLGWISSQASRRAASSSSDHLRPEGAWPPCQQGDKPAGQRPRTELKVTDHTSKRHAANNAAGGAAAREERADGASLQNGPVLHPLAATGQRLRQRTAARSVPSPRTTPHHHTPHPTPHPPPSPPPTPPLPTPKHAGQRKNH